MNGLRGYTEIEWNGKVYPFRFNTNAWALFCEARGIEFGQITDTGVFGFWKDGKMIESPRVLVLLDVFYAAHVSACRAKDEKPVKKEDIIDLIDEVPSLMERLQTAMLKGKLLGVSFTEEGETGNPQ
jgi:hypothetical protein